MQGMLPLKPQPVALSSTPPRLLWMPLVTAYVLMAPLLVLENGVQQLLKSGSEPRCVLSPSHLRDPTYLPLRLPRRSGLQCKRKGLGEKLPLQICLEKLPL